MDNLCHTLVGATIGECGARKWTPLATATLIIGANLPDIDALAYFGNHVTALGFRRGWTHGILAVALWPVLLAGAMWLYDSMRRLRRPGTGTNQAKFVPLLVLALLAVLSHPLLDFLNTYGVRFLMPFSSRWFYGDTLFIADPWVWIVLALGIVTGRVIARRHARRGAGGGGAIPTAAFVPARIAAGLVLAYVVAMGFSGAWARRQVADYESARGMSGIGVMVAPVPADPLRRQLVLAVAGGYAIGRWDWTTTPHMGGPWRTIQSDADAPDARRAALTERGRRFLSWSRLPVVVTGGRDGCPSGDVCIRDARYDGQAWAEVAIPVPQPVSSIPSPAPRIPNPGIPGVTP